MSSNSTHYNLLKLNRGDPLSENSYQFTDRNIETLDYLTYMGAQGHRHLGPSGAGDPKPTLAPEVYLDTLTSGNIPASTVVYYRFTWVDNNGAETAPSPITSVTTPAPLDTPGSATLVAGTGGSLLKGHYYYILSAYKTTTTQETSSGKRNFITLNNSGEKVTLTMPTLPLGATGWNIYRRSPGGNTFQFLASTTSSSYVDTGLVTPDCNRNNPNNNTTNADSAVNVAIPGATPTVPAGYTWKLYRSFTAGDWDNSLLVWVTEETFEGSGITVPTAEDVGGGTFPEKYPEQSEIVDNPSKIDLATETTGALTPAQITGSHTVEYSYPGTLSAVSGVFKWRCPFDKAIIRDVGLNLGVGSSPASVSVIVDVKKALAATPTSFTTVYTTTGNRPKILSGANVGARTVPDVIHLDLDDMLVVDITQAGGGATPTDHDLLVEIRLLTLDDSVTSVPAFT